MSVTAPNDDESAESGNPAEGAGRKAGDLLKKALTVGIGAAFLTEESIRGLVKELKLPKEMIGGLLSTANETKNQFLAKLSEDVIQKISESVDPAALVGEFFERNEVELNVKIRVKKRAEPDAAKKADKKPEPAEDA